MSNIWRRLRRSNEKYVLWLRVPLALFALASFLIGAYGCIHAELIGLCFILLAVFAAHGAVFAPGVRGWLKNRWQRFSRPRQ